MQSSPITPWARISAFHPMGLFSLRGGLIMRGLIICMSLWWWQWTAGMNLILAPPRSVWGWLMSTMRLLNSLSLCEFLYLFAFKNTLLFFWAYLWESCILCELFVYFYTSWKYMNTQFHQNVLTQLVKMCKKHKINFIFNCSTIPLKTL